MIKTQMIKVKGMSCVNCEHKITGKLKQLKGVKKVSTSYIDSKVLVTYNPEIISIDEIELVIQNEGYKIGANNDQNLIIKGLGATIILLALYVLNAQFGLLNLVNALPLAEEGMSYGMILVIGVLTSFHCVAMCGGISLSQSMGKKPLKSSFEYNVGRVLSYTMIGGIVGALGSVISFSTHLQGLVQLIAGVFMVIMGLNMLNIFPWLRRLNPRMPKFVAKKIQSGNKGNGAFYVGMLNGLMPCGPLQAMQIFALWTGSFLGGALSMFLFSIGTVPLMLGIGAVSSIFSKKGMKNIMSAGAVLVVMMGVSMLNRGLGLAGINIGLTPSTGTGAQAEIQGDAQFVTTELGWFSYEPIVVQAGHQVVWTIEADADVLNGCNNRLYIDEFEIEKSLEPGENIIIFTPEEPGTFSYRCWMNMIRSVIIVE